MNINELKDKINEFGGEVVKLLTIKKYIPISEKEETAKQVSETSIYEENGMKYENKIERILAEDLYVIAQYTDLELPAENIKESMDWLYENDIISNIKNIIGKDVILLNLLINNEITTQLTLQNSVESILNRAINIIIKKIPDEKGLKNILKNVSSTVEKTMKKLEKSEMLKK